MSRGEPAGPIERVAIAAVVTGIAYASGFLAWFAINGVVAAGGPEPFLSTAWLHGFGVGIGGLALVSPDRAADVLGWFWERTRGLLRALTGWV